MLPALRGNCGSCEDKTAHNKLLQAQKNLSYLKVNANAPALPVMRGEYKNEYTNVYTDINETDGVIAVNTISVFRFKKGEWVENASVEIYSKFSKFLRCKVYGEWKPEENALELIIWYYETAFKMPIKLKFNKSKTKLTLEIKLRDETIRYDLKKNPPIYR